jgi:hypothetical protein
MRRVLVRWLPLSVGVACLTPAVAAASPQVITCGSRITRDAVLTADLSCEEHYDVPAISVVASGVTVDLRGHDLSRRSGTVIGAEGVGRVTVRNGRILTEGIALSASGHGDRFVDLDVFGGILLRGGGGNTIVRGQLEKDLRTPSAICASRRAVGCARRTVASPRA